MDDKMEFIDPEEIIEFKYYDKINNKTVAIKDKRKIKTALDEMDEKERKQQSLIREFEACMFNENIHDSSTTISEDRDSFESDLESALQEVVDKITKKENISKKIKTFLKKHILTLTEKQLNVLFLYYFLDFTASEIAVILGISRQRISFLLKRITKKLKKKVI